MAADQRVFETNIPVRNTRFIHHLVAEEIDDVMIKQWDAGFQLVHCAEHKNHYGKFWLAFERRYDLAEATELEAVKDTRWHFLAFLFGIQLLVTLLIIFG